MKLADEVDLSEALVDAIRARHGLGPGVASPLPSTGIINAIVAIGDHYVLRLPREHPAHIAQLLTEAEVIPMAVSAGVRTARVVAFDDARDLLPVPYLVVERLRGSDLESTGIVPPAPEPTWRELGRDLARLHSLSPERPLSEAQLGALEEFGDPRALVTDRAHDGIISANEAGWLLAWLERLAPAAATPVPDCLVHGDVQMSNVLVDDACDYVALIDWGCGRWDDAAADFLAVPMRAVPLLLEGHREVAPLGADESAEARILWRRLQMVLAILPRGAAPGCAWGERPVAWLVDLLGFFASEPPEPWRELRPEPR